MGIAVRVELVSGRGAQFKPSPGRDFLILNHHTFRDLALAIDLAFGRWDLSHLHAFTLPGRERRLGFAFEAEDEEDGEDDDSQVRPGRALKLGDRFGYEFDYGDSWIHECHVEAVRVSEREARGDGSLPFPDLPLATFGWGSIPDQYGRISGDIDPYSATDEDRYPEGLEDVATLLARATTTYGRGRRDEESAAMLRSWISLGRPPRKSELKR